MSAIFISYRREETGPVAGRLYDNLVGVFGKDRVFRDIYTIPAGSDFPAIIRSGVAGAEAVVVLIGTRWPGMTDAGGRRRLDDPEDWVRLELEMALEHRKFILPVLVEGASMPAADDLPRSLKGLAQKQSIQLSDLRFEGDIAEMVRVLRERVPLFGSQAAGPAAFRGRGSFHVHIDGADMKHIEGALAELGPAFPSKVNQISGTSVSGAQRRDPDFDQTYRYHTPGSPEHEEFSIFSTTLLGAGPKLQPQALDALRTIIVGATSRKGPVVELERVVATIDERGVWRGDRVIPDPPELWTLSDEFPRLSTFPIEIHHAIDIKKDAPPLNIVEDLPRGPNIGGWFVFAKDDAWAYRSNQFADWSDYEHYARDGDARLRTFVAELQARGYDVTLRTLVEQVLGIWRRTDDMRREGFMSVPDLARWEMEASGEFWVVAANFLGDKSPDVKNAMVQNLRRGVSYTYFVRCFADVFRLDMLRTDLEESLSNAGVPRQEAKRRVGDQIRCVLVRGIDPSLADLLTPDYFICPRGTDQNAQGYQLQRGAIGGMRLEPSQVRAIIEGLKPLVEQKVEGVSLSISHEGWKQFHTSRWYAIVATDLVNMEAPVGLERWQHRLALYDRIVARQVSMFRDGDVVRPVRNGYLLVFTKVKDAVEFAGRVQSEIEWHNEEARQAGRREDVLPAQIVSLDFGSATRVLRAHGDDYVGEAVHRCIRRLDACRKVKGDDIAGGIAASESFSTSYMDTTGEEPFAGRPRIKQGDWTLILDHHGAAGNGSHPSGTAPAG